MAKLIYPIKISLDRYMEDENGNLEWSSSDDEVFTFGTDFQQSIGTYLYGRQKRKSTSGNTGIWTSLAGCEEYLMAYQPMKNYKKYFSSSYLRAKNT